MFDILMLPARHGDSLWLEYGAKNKPFRSLIDCGTGPAWADLEAQIMMLAEDDRHFELLVITHVDDDHIAGSLKLLAKAAELGVTFGDVWFNAYPHLQGKAILSGPDLLGAKQGEALSKLIVEGGHPWNKAFGGRAAVCPDEGELPQVELPSGMKITLLSPYWDQLEKMKTAWEVECRKAGLLPGSAVADAVDDSLGSETDIDKLALTPFKPDSAPANGSSIAFLVAFEGKTVLFGADAYAPVLQASLARLGYSGTSKLKLAALKAAHHGSKGNTNRDLLETVIAERLLISTNGAQFNHPDREAIARMVKFNAPDATLHFNYLTEFNEFWSKPARQTKFLFQAVYPEEGQNSLRVEL